MGIISDEVCENNLRYGEDCKLPCPSGCTDWCRKKDGRCPQCQNGNQGDGCNHSCAATCATCDKLTGKCIRCNGTYGENCDKNCTEVCNDGCNKNGFCSSCKEGFFSRGCEIKCSSGCQNGTCETRHGNCKCKAKHNTQAGQNCIPCPTNCQNSCNETLYCDLCINGTFGDRCQYNCSTHCSTTVCHRQDGSCICKVGYARNPCQKCPENCNEDGCDHTLRCERCKAGFYGDFCKKTCPVGCKNNVCERDGKCTSCKFGYVGTTCEDCADGYQGKLCNESKIDFICVFTAKVTENICYALHRNSSDFAKMGVT